MVIMQGIEMGLVFLGAYTLIDAIFDEVKLALKKNQIAKQLKELDRKADELDRRIEFFREGIGKQIELNEDILDRTQAVLNQMKAEQNGE